MGFDTAASKTQNKDLFKCYELLQVTSGTSMLLRHKTTMIFYYKSGLKYQQ